MQGIRLAPTLPAPLATAAPYPAQIAPAHEILQRVRDVPAGFVRTYGDISPGAPRAAGRILAGCEDRSVPWHRIVRADGSLALGDRQRALLEREGVPFRAGDRVELRIARLPE